MTLSEWIDSEVEALGGGVGRDLLLGFPVWGAEFVDRMRRYCLPSILAGSVRRLRIVTWTDGPQHMNEPGIEIRHIPPEIMAEQKYAILGACQLIGLRVAAATGAGWHMALPDHVYPAGYFDRLLALSARHEMILNLCLWSDEARAIPFLEAKRRPDGDLAIAPAELAAISVDCMHPGQAAWLMNGRDTETDMPSSHFLIWRGADAIHLRCPHLTPHYLSPRLCAMANGLPVMPVDSMLPWFIPQHEPFYVPIPTDGLTVTELATAKPVYGPGAFAEFVFHMRQRAIFDPRYLRYWQADCRIPAPPTAEGLAPEEIERQHAAIVERLMKEMPA